MRAAGQGVVYYWVVWLLAGSLRTAGNPGSGDLTPYQVSNIVSLVAGLGGCGPIAACHACGRKCCTAVVVSFAARAERAAAL